LKFGLYTLEADGTVPEDVVSGGFFPVLNDLPEPQDYKLLGIVNSESSLEEVTDLKTYLIQIGAEEWLNRDGEAFDIEATVQSYENMLVELEQELGA
jgi:hypothetical protein